MPSLIGTGPGDIGTYGILLTAKVCVAREFTVWEAHRTSPIIDWLRALATDLHATAGGRCQCRGDVLQWWVRIGDDGRQHDGRAGAEPAIVAVRVGQSSEARRPQPVARRCAAGRERAAAGCRCWGCVSARTVGRHAVRLARALLGDAFIAVDLPSTSKGDHSVLTEQRDEASVQQVIDFLKSKLQRAA